MTLPSGQPATLAAVTQEIIGLIEADGEVVNLAANSTLQDAGMDSAQVLSLVFRIEARYDIELDAEDGDDLRTVGDLAQLVAAPHPGADMKGAPAIRPKFETLNRDARRRRAQRREPVLRRSRRKGPADPDG